MEVPTNEYHELLASNSALSVRNQALEFELDRANREIKRLVAEVDYYRSSVERGKPGRKTVVTPDIENTIKLLRTHGRTISEIVEATGVSYGVVQKACKNL